MNIYGIGIDIVDINRVSKSIKQKRFVQRVFNKIEIFKCNKQKNKKNCYAKRFAAKEAFSKALGTGIANGINFSEIVVQNNDKGKPSIKLLGKTKEIVDRIIKRKFVIFLTLSDDKPFAIATVIISI